MDSSDVGTLLVFALVIVAALSLRRFALRFALHKFFKKVNHNDANVVIPADCSYRIHVRQKTKGTVVSYFALKRGNFEEPSRFERLTFHTVMLTGLITAVLEFARKTSRRVKVDVLAIPSYTQSSLLLRLTIDCGAIFLRGAMELRPALAPQPRSAEDPRNYMVEVGLRINDVKRTESIITFIENYCHAEGLALFGV